MKANPKQLDLFSGIGGMALGAKWAGYDTIAFSEIEPFCHDILTKRFPGIPNLGDVRKLCRRIHDCVPATDYPDHFDPDGEDLDELVICPLCTEEEGEPVDFGDCTCIGACAFTDEHGWPDVLTAGSPCQDFSLAGKGLGLEGERSGLIMEIPRIASELFPPFVLLENVPGIKARGFDEFAARMECVGYTCAPLVVPALAFGAEHLRERLFLVAHHPGIGMEGLWADRQQEPRPLDLEALSVRDRDGQWKVEPDLRRDLHGFPPGLDRPALVNPRLKAIGNALLPQVAECFLTLIRDYARIHRPLFPQAL